MASENFRDSIATVNQQGGRIWVYPKKPKGRFYTKRIWLSGLFLIILFGLPFIHVGGDPIFIFDIINRNFILFGLHFGPQDFYLFGLAMVSLVIFVALFTVVFGRIFCGWVCPQTIFMEMVFRRIEYWIEGDANKQRKLAAAPWTSEKAIKKISKHIIFGVIAIFVANTFLAYIIGIKQVVAIITEPVSLHMGGFFSMLAFSGLFYFIFTWFREQVCVAVCPYGRLQGVLLAKESIVVIYDWIRGEPRGKMKKRKNIRSFYEGTTDDFIPVEEKIGDCIDCNLCVQVCPTGIDIRHGTQLECVNCTACIDACDEVMDKIDRPRGLIRFDAHSSIENQTKGIINSRAVFYSVILVALIVLQATLFITRSDIQAVILRTPGTMYNRVDESHISNLYNFQLINKSKRDIPIEIRLENIEGEIKLIGQPTMTIAQLSQADGALFIILNVDEIEGRKTTVELGIYSGDERIDFVKTSFFGPNK